MPAEVFALNAHAAYACRHSGLCCTAGWTIPVDAHLLPLVGTDWLEPDAGGACPQYDRSAHRCAVHRDHGEAMLPTSCFQFPRRALIDSRGTSVALSLFCPTAASLLLESAAPLRIVSAPPAFPADRDYEGLDARDAWPPLLRHDVLFDPPSYTLWEHHVVDALGTASSSVAEALWELATRVESLRTWTLANGPLEEWTRACLSASMHKGETPQALAHRYAPFIGRAAFEAAAGAVPPGLVAPAVPEPFDTLDARWVAPQWDFLAPRLLRVLAAKAFASWTAYQSRGLRTHVAELFMTASVLRVECVRACAAAARPLDAPLLHEAVRQTDRLLVHLIDRDVLMPWLGKAEEDDVDFTSRA